LVTATGDAVFHTTHLVTIKFARFESCRLLCGGSATGECRHTSDQSCRTVTETASRKRKLGNLVHSIVVAAIN